MSALVLVVPLAVSAEPRLLPLERLRLYETGVGYFERTGPVGAAAVRLPVPASHLDDALKTLVVFSVDGTTRVSAVEFGSSVSRSMARALSGLPAEQGALGLQALLVSLKGAAVELRARGELVRGRIVEVLDADGSDLEACLQPEGAPAAAPCTPQKQAALVLLTNAGELRRFRVADVASARPTDPTFASRLGAALDALSDGSARLMKDLRVLSRSGKSLSLGYVSETPVWRASYRLVLAEAAEQPSALQGWALVHNDTDETWRGISVELVNGRPDSFLFPLAAPRYARRVLVTPQNELESVPQLMRETPDSLWNTDEGSGGLGLYGIGEGGGGRGEGVGLGSAGGIGHGGGYGRATDAASALLSVGNLAGVAAAEGVAAGALFRYAIAEPLDLRAHGSALVPFVNEAVTTRRIALFREPDASARSAVYLTHMGSQTLPSGTVAIYAGGSFAGEAALPRLRPKEHTTVEFGHDLDVELETSEAKPLDQAKLFTYSATGLVEHFVRRRVVRHRLENRSGTAREVFVRLSFVNNADVRGADELVYDTEHAQGYAVFRLAPQSKLEKELRAAEGLERRHPLPSLTKTKLRALAAADAIPAPQRALLLEAAGQLDAADIKRANAAVRRAELTARESQILRLREHARALGAAGKAVVERLLKAEDGAEALRVTAGRLEAEAAELTRRARTTLERIGG